MRQIKIPSDEGSKLFGVGFVNFVCFRNGTPFGFQRIQDNGRNTDYKRASKDKKEVD
jgi:hypothetical protein